MAPERTHAVVVGLDRYGFGSDRAGMVAQALAFARWLRDRGVPESNIVLLTSPLLEDSDGFRNLPANSATVQDLLYRDVLALEGEVFWLHWGGHGMVDEAGQRRLFVEDATQDDFRNINLDRLLALLRSQRARPLGRQIVTVDACQKFPGRKAPRLPDGIPVPPGNPPVPGGDQKIIFASPYGARAVYLSGLGGGVFSAALLDHLADDPAPEWPPEVRALPMAVKRRIERLTPNDPDAAQPIQVVYGDQDGSGDPVTVAPAPPSTTLPAHSRADLSALLAESAVDPATIVDTLWRALRAVSPISVDDAVDLEAIVDRLDQLPRRPQLLPPVLSFTEYLAGRLADPGQLRSWVDTTAEELGIDPVAVGQARASAMVDSTDMATFVTVKVEPVAGTTDIFTLSAALEREGAHLTLRLDDQQPCPTSEVRERCEAIVSRVAKFLPTVQGDLVTFEFLLPWSLLNAAVHRWRPASGGAVGGQLGLRGKVVVRSLDRLRYDGLAWRDWRERWNRLDAGESQIVFLHLSSALPHYYNSAESAHVVIEQHDADTLADRFLLAEDAACVMLSYPYEQRVESAVDGLQVAVAAGMPVAVWCGAGCDSAPLKAVVEELGKARGLARLPERVYRERRDARVAGADHYGRDVTLLWDDPYRIPELTEPLTAPTTEGARSHDSHH